MQQYPVIDPDTQSLIEGLLRIQEKHIIIKKETVDTLLKQGSFDPAFRTNLENYLNIAQVYYALPKGTLKEDIPLATSIKELAKLSNISSLEKTYHIRKRLIFRYDRKNPRLLFSSRSTLTVHI